MSSIAVWIDSRTPRKDAASLPVADRPGSGLDHLADVVVKLDQVDEDRPLDLQQQVLLVFLELGVQPVDHPLAGRLGARLALKIRAQRFEPPTEVLGNLFEGVVQRQAGLHVDRAGDVRRGAGGRDRARHALVFLRQAQKHVGTGLISERRRALIGCERSRRVSRVQRPGAPSSTSDIIGPFVTGALANLVFVPRRVMLNRPGRHHDSARNDRSELASARNDPGGRPTTDSETPKSQQEWPSQRLP